MDSFVASNTKFRLSSVIDDDLSGEYHRSSLSSQRRLGGRRLPQRCRCCACCGGSHGRCCGRGGGAPRCCRGWNALLCGLFVVLTGLVAAFATLCVVWPEDRPSLTGRYDWEEEETKTEESLEDDALSSSTAPSVSQSTSTNRPTWSSTSSFTQYVTTTLSSSSSWLASGPPSPEPSSLLRDIVATITDELLLRNASTPQSQALAWTEELLYFSTENSSLLQSPSDLLQKYALATAYFSWNGDDGRSRLRGRGRRRRLRDSWLSFNEHECSWRGVSCTADRRVTGLALPRAGLAGTLPDELGDGLRTVTHLTLYDNDLRGALPKSLGRPTNLTKVDLSRNALSGTIPWSDLLTGSSRLERLDLSENRLSGSLLSSTEEWASAASSSSLDRLWLFRNELTGTLPETLADAESLADLRIGFNSLTGTIPTVFGEMKGLIYMDLSHNDFTGTIPTEFSNLSQLETLRLNENRFTGTTPCPPNLLTLNIDSNVKCPCCDSVSSSVVGNNRNRNGGNTNKTLDTINVSSSYKHNSDDSASTDTPAA